MNGKNLRGIQSHAEVKSLLSTFVGNCINLVIAHDEVASVTDFYTKIRIDGLSTQRHRLSYSQRTDSLSSLQSEHQQAMERERVADEVGRMESKLDDLYHNERTLASMEAIPTQSKRHSCTLRTGLESNGKEHDYVRRARSSVGLRGLALTPTELLGTTSLAPCSVNSNSNSDSYTPVYTNRAASICVASSLADDEKWQLLAHKRCSEGAAISAGHSQQFGQRTHYARNSINVTNSHYRSLRFAHSRLSSSRLSLFMRTPPSPSPGMTSLTDVNATATLPDATAASDGTNTMSPQQQQQQQQHNSLYIKHSQKSNSLFSDTPYYNSCATDSSPSTETKVATPAAAPPTIPLMHHRPSLPVVSLTIRDEDMAEVIRTSMSEGESNLGLVPSTISFTSPIFRHWTKRPEDNCILQGSRHEVLGFQHCGRTGLAQGKHGYLCENRLSLRASSR